MPEHSPSPTPERAIYGFVLYLVAFLAFFMYMAWAWIPDSYLHMIGLTYWPQKYWAVVLPAYCCAVFLLSMATYFGLTFLNSPPLTSLQVITDNYAISSPEQELPAESIPPLADISISEVNKLLYL